MPLAAFTSQLKLFSEPPTQSVWCPQTPQCLELPPQYMSTDVCEGRDRATSRLYRQTRMGDSTGKESRRILESPGRIVGLQCCCGACIWSSVNPGDSSPHITRRRRPHAQILVSTLTLRLKWKSPSAILQAPLARAFSHTEFYLPVKLAKTQPPGLLGDYLRGIFLFWVLPTPSGIHLDSGTPVPEQKSQPL